MFLELPGKPLPKMLRLHSCTDAPMAEGVWGGERPKHLVTLAKAGWPTDVVTKIAKIFADLGVLDPEGQKLVEPYAKVFGGKNIEGEADLASVNWELAVDYFTWEAMAITRNLEESDRLQKEALKKYGGYFSHYAVYEDYSGYGR
jgi:hypothetical protein